MNAATIRAALDPSHTKRHDITVVTQGELRLIGSMIPPPRVAAPGSVVTWAA